ncbi:Holliday junction resolvase RecU [Oenococcus oeni]|uniref:Holliday junction resolvase RecU n=1 Tax=Oenococcus oeni TaxID=1247 RepID=UPI0008F8E5AE|nr:Holliday junction resolvase RecU [Oenococcus oeni]OIM26465.1 Holliday junction resolvase RecU [Oenococcus oeni]SYW15244.1 Holliday junction resolvase [Oenococcus oeni]
MVNYPSGVRAGGYPQKKKNQNIRYGKRGMGLEEMINQANDYYLVNHQAVIHKKPTPITVVHVDYPNRSMAKITEAYYVQPSTTDYNGVVNGKYIDFDAKETKNKTNMPLKNFHQHQITHLKNVLENGGIGFLVLGFTTLSEYYIFPASLLIKIWDKAKAGGEKSLPYKIVSKQGIKINSKMIPSLDYLPALKKLFNI